MTAQWAEAPLGKLLVRLIDHRGRTPKKLGGDFSDSGVRVISAKNIRNGRLDLTANARFISGDMFDRWMPEKLTAGDVLLTSEAPIGSVAFLNGEPNYCLGQRLFALRADPKFLDSRFLYYMLQSSLVQSRLRARLSGTTAEGIRQAELVQVHIPYPLLREQRAISGVLGAIDDLIENNRRRIELLEQLAQATYWEWFVQFRYPGREDDELVDSPLGPIPASWPIRAARELLSLDKGVSYKGAFLNDGGTPMVNLKCFGVNGAFRFDALKGYSGPVKPRHQVRPGDVVMANTDLTQAGVIIGRVATVPAVAGFDELVLSHHVFAVRQKSLPALFLLYALSERRFRNHARATASGTTVLGLNSEDVLAYPMLEPPRSVVDEFMERASSIHYSQLRHTEANRSLEKLRSLLLPKLVTGAIDASQLDLDFGEPTA